MNNKSKQFQEEIPNPFKQLQEQFEEGFSDIKNILLGLNLGHLKKITEGKDGDQILNIKEAAEYLNLSVSRMYILCGKKQIPSYKKGKKILFSKDELTAWLKEGHREIVNKIDAENSLPVTA